MNNKKDPQLLNKKIAKKNPNWLFEQYKIYAESAEKISQRRDNANQFYLTLNTAIISITGYLNTIQPQTLINLIISIFGIAVSYYWHKIIQNYQNLNTGKYLVIHEFEQHLPAKPYWYEWEKICKEKIKDHQPITEIEKNIPAIFMGAYIIILLFTFLNLAGIKIFS